MKLYTKGGDDGSTALFGGARVPKNNLRVAAYGDVDETNAAIGLALAAGPDPDPDTAAALRHIQSDLFILGGELATPADKSPHVQLADAHIAQLERWIDEACAETPPLQNFVLPGGAPAAAALHLARTVCRRAERALVTLAQREPVRPAAVIYLNRLSDLLFALARRANHRQNVADIPWIAPPS